MFSFGSLNVLASTQPAVHLKLLHLNNLTGRLDQGLRCCRVRVRRLLRKGGGQRCQPLIRKQIWECRLLPQEQPQVSVGRCQLAGFQLLHELLFDCLAAGLSRFIDRMWLQVILKNHPFNLASVFQLNPNAIVNYSSLK